MEKFSEAIHSFWNGGSKVMKKVKNWAVQHYKLSLPIVVTAILLAGVGIAAGMRNSSKEIEAIAKPQEINVDKVEEVALEENAHEEVNAFAKKYFEALTQGDADTIQAMQSYLDDTERIKIQKKNQYIEAYQNIDCYTKSGPMENSFIVYVYYEVKVRDIATLAPSLKTLYLYPNEAGSLIAFGGEMDDNIAEYLKKISTQDDVVDLFNRVQVKYNEAIEQDEALNTFLAQLPETLKREVGEEIAKLQAPAVPEETAVAVSGNEAPPTVVVETIEIVETVNVRSSDSTQADKLGKVVSGDRYTRLEARPNGWSKIQFEGKDGFIKTEFVNVVDTQTVEVAPEAPTETPENTNLPAAVDGKVTIKETVNIRGSASQTADKVGVAYQGEQFELVMKQADGWCKIKFKGQTAFVKTEFVQ